jgi:hypothetical protein|tara:strand:- start:31 stop:375 length:345 start_codon:yes stop_codon:yes gene_type:complete
MTIQYKNETVTLDTTSVKTLFTCPTSGVAIVKSLLVANDHNSDVAVKAGIAKAAAPGVLFNFFQKTMTSDSSENFVSATLNLEAGDSINAQATVSNVVTGVISYALIDRSQENG